MSIQHDYIRSQSESNYRNIYNYAKNHAKNCENRNFNYFITNPKTDNIAITYNVQDKDAFWGLNNCIDEQVIFNWISACDSPFSSREKLNQKTEELIEQHLWKFTADVERADLLSHAMCKRVLLAFSFHFFMNYQCPDDIKDELVSIWNETETAEFDYIDINQSLKHYTEAKGNIVKVNGRLPDAILEKLDQKGVSYVILEKKGKKIIKLSKTTEGKSILDLYKDPQIASVLSCVSPIFYSGAMARVKNISKQSNFGNERIFSYLFELESISYATHLGLKDPRAGTLSAFFTEEEKNALASFDKVESQLQDELLEKLENGSDAIDAINDYLSKSGYTHGMNTSGNIITSDQYLVYTKRGAKTFDSQTLYCSSNGVCEVFSENVNYYHHTVDCDLPSIAEFHSFGSFGKELTRETYAELGIYIEPTTWKYYGFTLMGYKSDSSHRFPLHFNILAHSRSSKTIKQIRHKSTSAVEKDENENVLGMSVTLANSWTGALKIQIMNFFQMVYSHKDFITDLLILFTVFSLFYSKLSSEGNLWNTILFTAKNLSYMDWASLCIATLTLIFTLVEFKNILSEFMQNYCRRYFFVKSENDAIITKCLNHALKNAKCKKINPIYVLMFQLYYYHSGLDDSKDS